jgi:hypothetical protein
VADVLVVAAVEFGDPVVFVILVEADDVAFHARTIVQERAG